MRWPFGRKTKRKKSSINAHDNSILYIICAPVDVPPAFVFRAERGSIKKSKKVEKSRKKVLTNGDRSGIVIKLSRAVELQRWRDEKSFGKSKKVLDKTKTV